MIYFLQPTDGGPVKIGFTNNLPTRHRALESHYGKALALLTTMPGGRAEEAAIHARFAHLRMGKAGRRGSKVEQFRPTSELMEFIGQPLLVHPDPEAIEVMPGIAATIINLKGSIAFDDWLEEVHQKTHIAKAVIVRLALKTWAKENGHKEPPEL